jgi:predicted RND superfamily exporter protein
LWAPGVRWTEVTEEGFRGGPVMPDNYNGSPAATEQLRGNIARSGLVGSLVGNDFKSSMIIVPLLDQDAAGGKRIDYRALSHTIEAIRARYEAMGEQAPVRIHAIGFAKLAGDLIDGLVQVAMYFAVAALIAAVIIFLFTRCVRSTALVIACSLVAVVWQLGLVAALGFELDPYSILVPFLVFAIGVSHGAQKMNGIVQDIGRGAHKLVAARYTFRRLFLAGLTALLADAVGFGVLMVIDIPVIRELALAASLGVAVLIFTNLILLPVLLSYVGVSAGAAARSLHADSEEDGRRLRPRVRPAGALRRTALVHHRAGGRGRADRVGYVASTQLKIGDLDPGAPELRADSRYNRDNAYTRATTACRATPSP